MAGETNNQGSGYGDLVSTQKGGVQNLASLVLSFQNAFPPATATASPRATGTNSLGTTALLLVTASTTRHGIVFHNPGTASVYVFPTAITTAPTVSAVGGSFLIFPGGSLSFAPTQFPNVNCSWSGFAATGAANALTIVEFY